MSATREILEVPSPLAHCRAFVYGECSVMVAEEPDGWHLSIAHPSRYPTWDEIRDARYEFLPDQCTVALLLPPRSEYVNMHDNCFHLHEIERPTRLVLP